MREKGKQDFLDIEEILKNTDRITVGHRWLTFYPRLALWEVFERLPRQHYARLITQSKSLIDTLNVLVEDKE